MGDITSYDIIQGSAAWHKLREGKYTGSNSHKLLKYGTGKYSANEADSFKGNYHTKRGHILESEALELYEKITKNKVARVGFVTNSDFDNCGYSPDGLVPTMVIEVKCFAQKKHLELLSGEIPFEVLAQVHFGMMICDKPLAHLVIYNPELDPKLAFKIIPIKANKAVRANFKRMLTA